MQNQNIFLSIIIPAHNEETRLPGTLDSIIAYTQEQPFLSEIVVVENGSMDQTAQIVRQYQERHQSNRTNLILIQESGKGKGLAVRKGMLAARGAYRFMCDADLSMPITEISRFIPYVNEQTILIASREAPGAIRYGEPQFRHIGGRLVNIMIRCLALPGLNDTQCGFKVFPAGVAGVLFRKQTLDGWAFDVELLFIARKAGLKIVEVPIPWYYNPESKVSPVKDAIRMLQDIFRIHFNNMGGKYHVDKL